MAQKTTLTDQDIMPCTSHKGKKMEDVPAQFLLWLREKAHPLFRRKYPEVMQYIEDNLETITMQHAAENKYTKHDKDETDINV